MPHDRHLLKIIRQAVTNDCVNFTAHAMKRMKERDIHRHMVIEALLHGKTRREPEPNPLHGSIEVELNHFMAGVNYAVIVAVIEGEIVVTVITVY